MKTKLSAVAVSVFAASVALTACGEPNQDTEEPAEDPAAQDEQAETANGDFNDADVEYASGMIVHHEQAVEMSDILLQTDDADPEVSALAEDIRAAQQPEIEQMESWLEAWGHEPEGDGDHGGMMEDDDHGMMGDGGHDGMMSEEDLDNLASAEGDEASRLFLDQMIIHHEGAVTMAEGHLEAGQNPEALELSENVIADQNAEIEEMEELRDSL
ncbi:DUF305 domain-containing protein [Nesterenkonia sphaerica]|uniref:DUF305 domain-containing protein n=1 Tax=Nesterenkonia sphaerica TaxID=1804988 RepID=A0A5R8ZZ71_9MICC|nr:DUF305 domain-containing protein [Nesterenkonia sphaerica]TLP71723.1 DUF305 domain-containing protein [Nesterenkonia sphaerica]